MDANTGSGRDTESELAELRARLAEAEETLRAIRHGEVDALLIVDGEGERVYTLHGADAPYRALVEQMQEGAVTTDAAGDVIYCNRYFAELVEAPLQQVIGSRVIQFIEAADREALSALIRGGSGKIRTRIRSAGRVADVSISVSTVTVDETKHSTLIVTNLSSLTKVQRESQSKDEFLAMLAHELRNPLGAIGGAIQVLGLVEIREARAVRAREVIQRQVLSMARLVDDLLDVGRVVTGKIVLDREPVDLADTVRACVAAMTSDHAVERAVNVAADPVWVYGDPVRLEQIVANLVSNALKFTPPDRAVHVSLREEQADAVLRVVDEGAGISPGDLPHIFDLFVQADVTTDRARGGLGIGLTLVRRLVELHGGTVEAASGGSGLGATFTVRLPASPASTESAKPVRPDSTRSSSRVLLVDDHADAREMYGMVLEAAGHEVHQAEDGSSALAIFRRAVPDVAVIDIGLPGMDGYEVARQIRSIPEGRHVTLIALTGYGFPEDRMRSSAAGFDRHLVKPVAPDDLRLALDFLRR